MKPLMLIVAGAVALVLLAFVLGRPDGLWMLAIYLPVMTTVTMRAWRNRPRP